MVNLTLLFCDNNLLTTLPDDMKKLQNLNCSNNRLTMLPLTFSNLKNLKCAGNQFTSAHLQDAPGDVNVVAAYKKYVSKKKHHKALVKVYSFQLQRSSC